MKLVQRIDIIRHAERGAASLVSAVVLVIATTIVAFISAQLVLNETRRNANDYRTDQAFQAATAAVEQGLELYSETGELDLSLIPSTMPGSAGCTVTVASTAYVSSDTLPNSTALYFFANEAPLDRCGANGAYDAGTLYGIGWSDDCEATRVISACIGSAPILDPDNSPEQPFITRAGVGVFGNARIINRYTNISIWAGESGAITGNAFETYLRPSDTEVSDLDVVQLTDDDDSQNTQLVSNRNSGFGLDVVLGDESLKNSSGDDLFNAFFSDDKAGMYQRLQGSNRNPSSGGSMPVNSGLDIINGEYWVGSDGPPSTTETVINAGDQIGSTDDPVVMVVNGDLRLNGGAEITGIVYVTGELTIVGNPKITGTIISENGPNGGGGTLSLVYFPFGGGSGNPPKASFTGSILPGSWRDW